MAEKKYPAAGQTGVQPGQIAELDIIGINQEGQGVARLDGLTVFIPQTVPGDRVVIRVEKRLSNYAVGQMVKLAAASADRILPVCSQSGECGGCSLQMMNYPAQLRQKQQQVYDALRRIGRVHDLDKLMRPIIGMDEPWQYRSKVQFPVAGSTGNPEIGFYANRSHRVIHAPTCPVQPPVCDIIRETVADHVSQHGIEPYNETRHRGLLRHIVVRIGFFTGQVMVVLVINGESLPGQTELYEALHAKIAATRDPRLPPLDLVSFYLNINKAKTNLIMSEDCRLLAGTGWIEEIILGLRYRISPLSFFQVNPRQTERLYSATLELAALGGCETALDLYCGTGSISLLLARQARQVVGIEIIPEAIADARVNAELNGISNTRFAVGRAEQLLPMLLAEGLTADVAVVDPPRKGCDTALLEAIVQAGVSRVVYVSCNPATLARDVAVLQVGGYHVQVVQPVDMFPWTGHVETVVLMTFSDSN